MRICPFKNTTEDTTNNTTNNTTNDITEVTDMTNIQAIYCDTRQQDGKHKNIEKGFVEMGIMPIRTKLYVGDYCLPTDQSVVIDTKKDLMEVSGNLCQQYRRFAEEANRAATLGIELIILIEENDISSIDQVHQWYNWRLKNNPKSITGEQLEKIMKTFAVHHGCRFEFCKKDETAKKIIEILSKSLSKNSNKNSNEKTSEIVG